MSTDSRDAPVRGRLAPSPSGLLHVGHAWAFLLAWLGARRTRGTIVLRLEDIDRARCKDEFTQAILRDLEWLGLHWDEGPVFQSQRLARYDEVLRDLADRGLTYPCTCTRKELRQAASAPHATDGFTPYPGTCRPASRPPRRARDAWPERFAVRLMVEGTVAFDDLVHGRVSTDLATRGDVALCRADGVHAYQLAAVVDDVDLGVTQVVRGDDLLDSTPWQLALQGHLGAPPPDYAHIPLVCGADGERLAKRQESLTLSSLREANVDPRVLLGRLAHKGGLTGTDAPVRPEELLPEFSFARLGRSPLIWGAADPGGAA